MIVHIIDGARKAKSKIERDRFHILRGHWFPILLAERNLADIGINLKFFESFSPESLDCDVAIVSSRHVDQEFHTSKKPKARAEAVALISRNCDIIWFDLRDSSGTAQFEVLPHVSRYVKQSLLNDLELYTKPFHGGRIFTDFIFRTFGVRDERMDELADNQEDSFTPLDLTLAEKLTLGWNVSYSVRGLFASERAEQAWIDSLGAGPIDAPPVALADLCAARPIAVAAMMSDHKYVRDTIAHQRKRALALLRELERDDVVATPRPYDEYLDTIRMSRIALSCFGNGEICYRECEAWIAGCAVMMPDMSHLQSFPNLYEPFGTYMPLDWGLENLLESIDRLESDKPLREGIARRGQHLRSKMFSREGIENFSIAFHQIVSI